MRDPLGPPPLARHPDTVFIIGLCLFAGGAQLAAGTEPGTVSDLVPKWISLAWAVLLTTGSVIILVGVFWRSRLTGVLIEAVGRTIFGPTAVAYGVAIIAAVGDASGLLAAAPLFGFGLAALWRVAQIARSVHDLRSVLNTMTEAAKRRGEP